MSEAIFSNTLNSTQFVGPGARLRLAREAFAYTPLDVARHLRLREQQILDIEKDEYSTTTRFVFIRGYLRGYAKFVQVPADEVIQAFERLGLEQDVSERPKRALRSQPAPMRTMPLRWITYFVALGLVALVGLWWNSQRHVTPELTTDITSAAATAAKDLEKAPATATTTVVDEAPVALQQDLLPLLSKEGHDG
jgi:cytoskeletal protein RodZ